MADQYDYEIISEKLDRPLGPNHYAARLHMVKIKENGEREQIWPEGLGETWGKTWDEAYDKMSRAIEEWIAKQG